MTSTTARDQRDDKKRTDEAILETDAQFIAGLKVFSGDSESVSGLAGGNAQNSPKSPAGNYLAREGDSMIGPIALGPPVNFRVQIGTEENINISQLGDNPQYSSNIELDSIQPNGFVLDRIDGANFDGQILIIRTFGPGSFTISQATLANGGNIQTPNDEDFELPALSMIQLVFDEALIVHANTGGTWRVMSGGDVGGGDTDTGTYASAKMDTDQGVNLAAGQHVQFNDYTENGGIVLQGLTPTFNQTSGIFELKAGKTYYLSAYLDMQFNANADNATFHWYDITNGIAVSQVMTPQPTNAANTNSMNLTVETIFTPVADVNVELRIASVFGAITTIFKDGSQANIFEFSGKNGAVGPAGSGASWKNPARGKSVADVPNLAAFTVNNDGITLIQGDRVLLTDQTTQSENGLWEVGVVAAGLAPLTRPADFDQDAEVVAESFVAVEEGTSWEDTLWHLTSDNPLAIDVSAQVWTQIGGAAGQTPWLSNIDADKFILFDLNEVIFTNTVPNGPVAGLNSIFWSNGTGNMVHQIRPGSEFQILEGDFDSAANTVATFSKSLIDFTYQTLPFTLFEAGDMIVNGISQYNDRMTLKTTNVTFPQPNFSPSSVVAAANDGGDLGTNTRYWNNLNVKQIRLRDGDVIIDIASIAYDSFFNGTVYNVPNGDSHLFKQFDGAASTDTLFEVNETEIDAWTHLIRNVVDPVAAQDAATKNYVDTNTGGTWKIPVRAKADGFTFLFPNIQQVIDGVTLAQGDRVLLTDELLAKNNGIWKVNGPFAGIPLQAPLIRPDDFNSDSDMVSEVFTSVEEGDLNRESVWHLVTPNPIFDNVTSQLWRAFRSGVRELITIGVLDAPNSEYIDTGYQWFGNDNGADGLTTQLPIAEPGGFTISYTIDANDFPVGGVSGIEYKEYSGFISWGAQNTTAGVLTLFSKTFLNGNLIGSQDSSGVAGGNWAWGYGWKVGDDVQVGDTMEFKLWGGVSLGDFELNHWAVYIIADIISCFAASTTVNNDFDNDQFVGGIPSAFASTPKIDGRVFPVYTLNSRDGFFTYEYGNGEPRMVKSEQAFLSEVDNNDMSNGSPIQLAVPALDYINKYALVY